MANPAHPTPEDLQAESLAQDIAGEMPSPYCPGRSIASCPSDAARQLEEDILGLAKQGMDRDQIEEVLVDRFGKETMGQAHSPVVLVGIGLASLVALAVIVQAARAWMRGRPGVAPVVAGAGEGAAIEGVSRAELDRLEDELDNLREL
ncbi:cytochrome c-type biogenesis protein CcmH [Nannocystaceae bacterium ST9]